MEFVKTGIAGFDNLFANGGYPKENTILVMGGPGSGKSIFGVQFLYKGVVEYGEPGVYVSLDEPPKSLRRNVSSFGWDLEALEAEGKIKLMDILEATSARPDMMQSEQSMTAELNVDSALSHITNAISEVGATRLVIDSLSIMNLHADSDAQVRTNMLRLSGALSQANVTALVINDAKTNTVGIKEFPHEAFVFDGVITLNLDSETQERRVSIRKMRGTKHVIGSFRFDITDSGISVMP